VQLRAVLELPATLLAPGAARHAARALLHAWEALQRRDDVELVLTEIITNAVRHAELTPTVDVEITLKAGHLLRLTVADGSSLKPTIGALAEDQESGRGMQLVAAVADRWGVDEHPGGKIVWIELDLPG
jgi:anti-sigma regulatory factor (Ser/Thr protein kinase)